MDNIFMRFPEGKKRALTLSYDDGVEQDARLIEIMKRHGLKGTFNISSEMYSEEGYVHPEGKVQRRMTKSQCQALYKNSGMEIAVHGLHHRHMEKQPLNLCVQEVAQDRLNLEKEYGCIVRGMAYPYGTTSDEVVEILRMCGIAYARTTVSTKGFDIPTDWLRLSATCRHADPELMELAHRFVETDIKEGPALFYLWGHAYEFEGQNNWSVIEEFAEFLGSREDIWYATNIEIYDYVEAYRKLIFSMDGSRVYNPTCTILYMETPKGLLCVKPGEMLCCQ
ncbi:MAG: polysaccharide deacetylase family protein [Lachnospiraceae bacterium]|nr:polysaccharide deacetylase family protein [Lachnospiraceae bacterium]